MPQTEPLNPALLDKVLAGKASTAEAAQLRRWADADPRHAVLLARLRAEFTARSPIEAEWRATDAAWRQLRGRLDGAPVVMSPPRSTSTRRWRGTARLAASLLVAIGGTLAWQSWVARGGSLVAASGHQASITLPDGSRLTVAPGSRARWGRDFAHGVREIRLDGEAYFDVVHDDARPFRVRARGGVVEDVGTKFAVRAWPELSALEVAVEEGIVALTDSAHAPSDRGVQLRAGRLGRLLAEGRVSDEPLPEGAFAWLRGALVFDSAPLSIVLPAIGRMYDIELHADPALANRRLSASLHAQSTPQLLDALALALDVRIARDGNVYTLTPR